MDNIVSDIICRTFTDAVGKFQCKKDVEEVLHVEFRTAVDYEKEEGYRHLDLVIYAPANYVQVWVRRRWNVCDVNDFEYDEESGESFVKADATGYVDGHSDWVCIGDHDSGWCESVRSFIFENRNDLQGLSLIGKWFEVKPVSDFNLPERP